MDVLTVKNILYHSFDHELALECQPDLRIATNSLELLSLLYWLKIFSNKLKRLFSRRSTRITREIALDSSGKRSSVYFMLPENIRQIIKRILPYDDKIGWYPYARKAALKMCRSKDYNLIMTSLGPYTPALVAAKISDQTGISLLIDYRDHWTMNPYEGFLTPLHRWLATKAEKAILSKAVCITTVSKTMCQELRSFSGKTRLHNKVFLLYNGFDESDFLKPHKQSGLEKNKMTGCYTGNFFQQRTPYYFCEAVKKLLIGHSEIAQKVLFRFVGNFHRDSQSILTADELSQIVELIPQVEHSKAISIMLESDFLLLFIPSCDGQGVLTSKIFEYIRSEKPILAMIPERSEAASIIRSTASHLICDPENIDRIEESLLSAINGSFIAPQAPDRVELVNSFSRQAQTLRLHNIIMERIYA